MNERLSAAGASKIAQGTKTVAIRISSYWTRFGRSSRLRGIGFTVVSSAVFAIGAGRTRWFLGYRQRQFDNRYGVDTAGEIESSALGLDERSNHYEPSTPERVSAALSRLPIEYEDRVFLDIGSGKGLALLMASMFAFKRVVGVELAPQLCAIANHNIRAFRSSKQRCHDFEVICADAASFVLPAEPLVIYLYNPFKQEVLQQVMLNIRDSLEEHPRNVMLVYVNPVCDDIVAQADFLQPVPCEESGSWVRIYAARHRGGCSGSLALVGGSAPTGTLAYSIKPAACNHRSLE